MLLVFSFHESFQQPEFELELVHLLYFFLFFLWRWVIGNRQYVRCTVRLFFHYVGEVMFLPPAHPRLFASRPQSPFPHPVCHLASEWMQTQVQE